MDFLTSLLILIGRVLISALFLAGAASKLMHWHHHSELAKSRGIPSPQILFPVGMVLQLLGGLLILLGFYSRFGAILLLIYSIPTMYWMHSFWETKEHEKRRLEKAFFMKSLAVIGGLLYILAVGSGRFGFGM